MFLLVAQELLGGGVSGAMSDALILVNEQAVFLHRNLFLQTHAVVLEIFQSIFCISQFLYQSIDGTGHFCDFVHQSEIVWNQKFQDPSLKYM